MYLKAKDGDELLPEEGPEPGSEWVLVFDGVFNAYGSGIGAIIITPKGSHIPFTARLMFDCTNSKAEYEACIMGLEEAIDLRIKILDVYGYSALVFHHIPRKENQMEDALVTLSSMYKVNCWNDAPNITIIRLDRPSHVFVAEEVTIDKPWYYDIKYFLQS
ncbi:uncharacterized protein LOC127095521 [Lathyrus oleraceus]|uniref:uncharacterized protein LOC127095521 n=1 Tax=Pisum sativum TaxID=3888 RepID=UPI0021D3B74B|nr:uncharacterized protein LOC127095521 [Pisum sativum]